ncbi:hypothetical protein EI94DRAFT_1787119 [Lactarius quietus]|nr:hypothetical protein EI94DRAFT_1787119 [Lactarius quietus]
MTLAWVWVMTRMNTSELEWGSRILSWFRWGHINEDFLCPLGDNKVPHNSRSLEATSWTSRKAPYRSGLSPDIARNKDLKEVYLTKPGLQNNIGRGPEDCRNSTTFRGAITIIDTTGPSIFTAVHVLIGVEPSCRGRLPSNDMGASFHKSVVTFLVANKLTLPGATLSFGRLHSKKIWTSVGISAFTHKGLIYRDKQADGYKLLIVWVWVIGVAFALYWRSEAARQPTLEVVVQLFMSTPSLLLLRARAIRNQGVVTVNIGTAAIEERIESITPPGDRQLTQLACCPAHPR